MSRPRVRRVADALAALIGLAGLALAGTPLAAQAAPGDVVDSSTVTGEVTYVLRRTVDDQPGNAHSGRIAFDTAGGAGGSGTGTVTMLDWSCPAGVRPPTDLPAAGSACTLLRSRAFLDLTGPTFSGVVAATWSGPFALHQDVPRVATRPAATFYLAFHRPGPLRVTTNVIGDPPFTDRVLTRSTMELTGRLDWLRLRDPGLSVRFHDYVRETRYRTP